MRSRGGPNRSSGISAEGPSSSGPSASRTCRSKNASSESLITRQARAGSMRTRARPASITDPGTADRNGRSMKLICPENAHARVRPAPQRTRDSRRPPFENPELRSGVPPGREILRHGCGRIWIRRVPEPDDQLARVTVGLVPLSINPMDAASPNAILAGRRRKTAQARLR
jgi:hypothetical protein